MKMTVQDVPSDILLINPHSWDRIPGYIPTGLCYMAAVLRDNGVSVGIYDRNTDLRNADEVLSARKAKIYGISVLTGRVILDAIEIALSIRRLHPEATIIWGGLHPTIFPEAVLAEAYVDLIVRGEGEYPLLELCRHLLDGKGQLADINNVGYKKNGEIVLNPVRPFIDLEALPLPAWDLLNDMNNYFITKSYSTKAVNLNTSRGCPHRCAFCYNEVVNERTWRGMSAGRIVEQIDHLVSHYGIDGVFFHEDNFDVNRNRIREFCSVMIERKINIKWEHFSKVNYANEDLLKLEYKAGCRVIAYGLESGSDRILALIFKDQTNEDIRKAFKMCRSIGINPAAAFIIGYPMETMDDLQKTLDVIREIKPLHAFPQIYNPYPGTVLFKYVVDRNLFKLPVHLKEQGLIYSVDNLKLNMSSIPSDVLNGIIKKRVFPNLMNEVLAYLRNGNIKGLFRAVLSSLRMKVRF